MSNPWFRMYHEFAVDPKVQMLSEVDQRRYIMVLCLRCCNGDVTLQDETVAFQLRISNDEWLETRQNLMDSGLINADSLPTAWDKRQYVSDSSAERVRKHRQEKKKPVKQSRNVTVTPPDTDSDTETDTDKAFKNLLSDVFENLWSNYPNKQGRKEALRHYNASVKTKEDLKDIGTALINYLNHLKANTWKRAKNGNTWFNNWKDFVEWEEPEAPTESKPVKTDPMMDRIRKITGGQKDGMAAQSTGSRTIGITDGSHTLLPE